jgi:archaellum component FlaC
MGIKDFIFTIVQQAVQEVIAKEVNTRIDRLENRINEVEKSFNQRIDGVEKSLTQRTDDQIRELEKRFKVRFDNIEKALANIQGNLEGEARFFHLADYLKKRQSQ